MAGRTVIIFAILMTVMMARCEDVEGKTEEILYGDNEEEGMGEEEGTGEKEEEAGEMGVTEAWFMRRPFPPPHPFYPHSFPPPRPHPHPRPPIQAYHNPLPPRSFVPHPRPIPRPPVHPHWPRENTVPHAEGGGGQGGGYWADQGSQVGSGQGYMTNGSLSEALNVLWTSR